MTVKGDLAAYLHSVHNIPMDKAREIVGDIFKVADDPCFALSYAKWCDSVHDEEFAQDECDYWNVIKFLREVV